MGASTSMTGNLCLGKAWRITHIISNVDTLLVSIISLQNVSSKTEDICFTLTVKLALTDARDMKEEPHLDITKPYVYIQIFNENVQYKLNCITVF